MWQAIFPVYGSGVLLLLCACTQPTAEPVSTPIPSPPIRETPSFAGPSERTRILSQVDAQRVLANKGITLQWIDWNTRGTAIVTQRNGQWHLSAAQAEAGGPGRLYLDGDILEIGDGYFTFRGTIRITATPETARRCEENKTWHFAVTQNRPYYRLREFEWCDRSTDYIDLYF